MKAREIRAKESKVRKSVAANVSLGPVLQRYFCDYLVSQRDLSQNTIVSYRDTFRLLLGFLKHRYGIKPEAVSVQDLDAPSGPARTKLLFRQGFATCSFHSSRMRGVSWLCFLCFGVALAVIT